MKITRFIFVVSVLFLASHAWSSIKTISSLNQLQSGFAKATKNTLVVFDVDRVLIMTNHEDTINRHPYRKKKWHEMKKRLSPEEMNFLYSVVFVQTKWQLVDPDILDLLDYLKLAKIPTIALTSLPTGKVGGIAHLEDARLQQLKKLGLDFRPLTPFKKTIFLEDLKGTDGIPLLKAGVVFTSNLDKGKILERIFRENHYRPQIIIMVDDQIKNLHSLKAMCRRLNIIFYGFHYTALSHIPPSIIDQEKENLRFYILENEHRWLNYHALSKRKSMIAIGD